MCESCQSSVPDRHVLPVAVLVIRRIQPQIDVSFVDLFAVIDADVPEIEAAIAGVTWPELKAPRLDAYFVYPEEMRHSKRVAVFRGRGSSLTMSATISGGSRRTCSKKALMILCCSMNSLFAEPC